MPDLMIENVPDGLLKRLERSAAEHRRSLSGEVIARLEESAPPPRINPEAFLARLDEIHRRLNAPPLTDELLEQAINEGRL